MSTAAYASSLRHCISARSLSQGKHVHHQIIHDAMEHNLFIANLTLHMYGNCGALDEARTLFCKTDHRDRFTWNFIIMACVQSKKNGAALFLFYWMIGEGFMPDKFIYPSILSACSEEVFLDDGRRIHSYIKSTNYDLDLAVANALISMYGNCGSLVDAKTFFDKMVVQDAISWNSIIHAYAQHKQGHAALYLYKQMDSGGVQPTKATFTSILMAFEKDMTFADAAYIHGQVRTKGLQSDLMVCNSLIGMYTKCHRVPDAERIFKGMLEQDIISWSNLITAHMQHDNNELAIYNFLRMQEEGMVPDRDIFANIVCVCTREQALFEGKRIHARLCNGGCSYYEQSYLHVEVDARIMSNLISMYCKCGSLQEAEQLFDILRARDCFTWNDVIVAQVHRSRGMEAVRLYHQMQEEGLIPDKFIFASVISACTNKRMFVEGKRIHTSVIRSGFELDSAVGTALVNMYGRCDSFEEARMLFEKMPERTTLSWSSMITVFVQYGHAKYASQSFLQMCGEGLLPNIATYVSVFSACADLANFNEGLRLHASIYNTEFKSDVVLKSALVNMYGKCGNMKNACEVFNVMQECNIVTWNALISAYTQHGQGIEALKVFKSLLDDTIQLDDITFLSVLSACSHSGLVDEGVECFALLHSDSSITPDVDHFNCMIDSFGRAGRLDEAESLVTFAPFHPTVTSWITLLNACRHQSDKKKGKSAASHGSELDSEIPGVYISLSNLSAGGEKFCRVNEKDELDGLGFSRGTDYQGGTAYNSIAIQYIRGVKNLHNNDEQ